MRLPPRWRRIRSQADNVLRKLVCTVDGESSDISAKFWTNLWVKTRTCWRRMLRRWICMCQTPKWWICMLMLEGKMCWRRKSGTRRSDTDTRQMFAKRILDRDQLREGVYSSQSFMCRNQRVPHQSPLLYDMYRNQKVLGFHLYVS